MCPWTAHSSIRTSIHYVLSLQGRFCFYKFHVQPIEFLLECIYHIVLLPDFLFKRVDDHYLFTPSRSVVEWESW